MITYTLLFVIHLILWALFVSQSVVILLLRQVGVLHLRIGPSGARILSVGPEIGQAAPEVLLEDMDKPHERLQISRAMEQDILLLFVASGCPACHSLMVAIKPLVRETRGSLRWVVVATGEVHSSRQFRSEHRLDYLLFAHAPKLADEFKVGLTPYGILFRKDGMVISKGVVNHLEHLESLMSMRDWKESGPVTVSHRVVNDTSVAALSS